MVIFVDRRQHQRYKTIPDACAAFSGTTKRGRIINISEGGLAFQYQPDDNIPGGTINDGENKFSNLIVYIEKNGLCVGSVPVKIISDFEINNNTSSDIKKLRQCCVQFSGMDSFHTTQIKSFIKQHTTGPADDRRTGHDRRTGKDRRTDTTPQYSLFDRRSVKSDRRAGRERRSFTH